MRRTGSSARNTRGAFAAEVPGVLWVLLIGLTFPMLNFATVTLRSNFLGMAAREAASVASKSSSFRVPLDSSHPSAQSAALSEAATVIRSFNEVHLTSVTTRIVTTNINSGATTKTTNPLTAPADTTNNIYAIEVSVTGQVDPIVTYNGGFFGSVPGLTGPITTTCIAREFCEYPQGLTQ